MSIEELQAEVARLHDEIERLRAELVNSNAQLHNKVVEAREAARWLFENGDADYLEERGATKDWPWLED